MKISKRVRRLPADQRRAVTVQAVIELAAERNPSEITTSAIADHMQMTQGALFRHFPSKDALWRAVMRWVAERTLARVDEATRAQQTPLAALESVFMAHIEANIRHAGIPRLVFSELQRAGDTRAKRMVRSFMDQYIERLQALIQQGKDRGEVAPGVKTKAAATLFVGMIQGLVVQSLVSGKPEMVRARASEIFALYLRGIRSAP